MNLINQKRVAIAYLDSTHNIEELRDHYFIVIDSQVIPIHKENFQKDGWKFIKSTELAMSEDYASKNQTTKIREEIKRVFADDIAKGTGTIQITYNIEDGTCVSDILGDSGV